MKKLKQQSIGKGLIMNGISNKISVTERKIYFSWMNKILLLLTVFSFIFVFSEANKKWKKSKKKLIPHRIMKGLNLTEEQKNILKQNAVKDLSLRQEMKKQKLDKMKKRLNVYQIVIDHFSKPSFNKVKFVQAVQQETEKDFTKNKKYNFLSQRINNQIIFFESLDEKQKKKVEKWLQKGLENKMKRNKKRDKKKGKKKNKKWQGYKLIDIRVLNKIPREINFSDDQRKVYIEFFSETKNQKKKKSKRKKLSITKEVFEATKNNKMSAKEKKELISKIQQNKQKEYEQKRKEKKEKLKKEASQLFDFFESLDEEQKKKVIALIKSEKEKKEQKLQKKSDRISNKKR